MSTSGGYHEYIGNIMMHVGGYHYVLIVSPNVLHIPRCTEHTLYSVILSTQFYTGQSFVLSILYLPLNDQNFYIIN